MRWDVECIPTGRIFLWEMEDVPKESQLAISNMVDKKLDVGHVKSHSDCNMIFSFYVEHNPVAGCRKGIDFTFLIIRYHE